MKKATNQKRKKKWTKKTLNTQTNKQKHTRMQRWRIESRRVNKRGDVVRDIAKNKTRKKKQNKKTTLAFSQNKVTNKSVSGGKNQSSKKREEQEIKYYCR